MARRGHDECVALLLVVLLAGLLLASAARKPDTASPPKPANAPKRDTGRFAHAPLWGLGAVLLVVVCLRFGTPWLAVLGGLLVAAGRGLLPLLRFVPLLLHLKARRQSASRPPGEPDSRGTHSNREASGSTRGRSPRMSRDEALEILGLDQTATADDVRREYRRLMKKLHPDLGGSSYLAAKVNEARDVLS
jgi:DnaJ domain